MLLFNKEFECSNQHEVDVVMGVFLIIQHFIINYFLMLQTFIFDVVDVEFRCCRHVMLGVVSKWEEGGGSLMLDVARNIGRNMSHLVLSRGGRGPLMLDAAHNITRNMSR
jgi:hypothetical protein